MAQTVLKSENVTNQPGISDALCAKLKKIGNRIWAFSRARQKHPYIKFLIEEALATLISINNLRVFTAHFPDLIIKHKEIEVLLCTLRADDDNVYLSIFDAKSGLLLEQTYRKRGWAKIGDLDFFAVRVQSTDEVEKAIIFTGKNSRESIKEEVKQCHHILFCYEED